MKRHGHFFSLSTGAAIVAGSLAMAALPASAEEPVLAVELNTVTEIENGCRLSFLAENTLGADLSVLVLETVLFTVDGGVDRLTLFDFQDLPRGRPRVRQFDLNGSNCVNLGDLLINGVQSCIGEGLAGSECSEALSLSSRTDHEVKG